MNVRDLSRALEAIAPLEHAEPWDNVGLLAGDPDARVASVLLTIDCTREVVEEAVRLGCQAIVSYHPPIFDGVKRVTKGSIAFELVSRGIAVWSPHTALDAAQGGTNDVLADALGLRDRAPIRGSALKDAQYKLVVFVPTANVEAVSEAMFAAGAGRIGDYRSCSFRSGGTGTFFGEEGTKPAIGESLRLETVDEVKIETVVPIARVDRVVAAMRGVHPYEEPAFDLVRLARTSESRGMGRIGTVDMIDRGALIERVKRELGLSKLLIAGPTSGEISRVAVCAGSAGELVHEATRQGAQVVVTGEARHHDALRAAAAGVTLVCTLHSNSERGALKSLETMLAKAMPGLEVKQSAADRDPFSIT